MDTTTCPRCHGTKEEVYHNLSGIEGDTSYDFIPCRVCSGSGTVPGEWANAWEETGFEGRCDRCGKRRPCAIVFEPDGGVAFLCAPCSAAPVTAEPEKIAS